MFTRQDPDQGYWVTRSYQLAIDRLPTIVDLYSIVLAFQISDSDRFHTRRRTNKIILCGSKG